MELDLRRSPLEAEHRALGAKLGPFGGWLMPIEYAGTLAEHRAVRERAGLFDLSHLGKVDVAGPSALEGLQGLLTNDIASVAVGRARYSLLLNERGGVEEDLIVYRLSEDRYFVVPNASNTERVVAELVAAVPGRGAGAPVGGGARPAVPRGIRDAVPRRGRGRVPGRPAGARPHRLHGGAWLRAVRARGRRPRSLEGGL